jgi:hypothetical protein
MDKTLAENHIVDEAGDFEKLSIDEDFYISALNLYYNDDLSVL